MFAYDTPEKIRDRETQSEEQKIMGSWGYKFEQYMDDSKFIMWRPPSLSGLTPY